MPREAPYLPPELIPIIAGHLTPLITVDALRLRAICRSWRTAVPPPPHNAFVSPILPLAFGEHDVLDNGDIYLVSSAAVYLVRRPQTLTLTDSRSEPNWLLFVDELNHGQPFLRFPFSLNPVAPSPFNFLDRGLNLLDFGVQEVCRYYSQNSYVHECRRADDSFSRPNRWSRIGVRALLLPSGNVLVLVTSDGSVAFQNIVFYVMDDRDGKRIMDWKWCYDWHPEVDGVANGGMFDDILDHKGRVYVVSQNGITYVVDYATLDRAEPTAEYEIGFGFLGMTEIARLESGQDGRRKRLVESSGELYLVAKRPVDERTVKFKVYKLNEDKGEWVEVTSLGGRVFFIGSDFSFSVLAHDLGGSCQENCIFFYSRAFKKHNGEDRDPVESLYERKNISDLDITVYQMEDDGRFGMIASFPGYSELLWPPPAWLKEVGR
ncbi:F-box protein SKIP23-like protein [Drosera capensis]